MPESGETVPPPRDPESSAASGRGVARSNEGDRRRQAESPGQIMPEHNAEAGDTAILAARFQLSGFLLEAAMPHREFAPLPDREPDLRPAKWGDRRCLLAPRLPLRSPLRLPSRLAATLHS